MANFPTVWPLISKSNIDFSASDMVMCTRQSWPCVTTSKFIHARHELLPENYKMFLTLHLTSDCDLDLCGTDLASVYDTSFLLLEHFCKVISKSIHARPSWNPRLCKMSPCLTSDCDFHLNHRHDFYPRYIAFKRDVCAKLFQNQSMHNL